jgi:hypothetical protein
MALLQALLAMLGRSAGKVLNAIFGWAVRALFGSTSGAEFTLLSGLVATAAMWPLLLVGIGAPRVTAFLLAFVPISQAISSATIRIVWIALALFVPALVGLVMAMKAPPGAPRESVIVRAARGYPITVGIAAAFLIAFATVPVLRLRSAIRKHAEAHVPLITTGEGYASAAARIQQILAAHGFEVARRPPAFWMRAPTAILRRLGGDALEPYAPERIAYLAGPGIEAVLHPSSLLLRGPERTITVAHGLIVEGLTATDAYQTTDGAAQDVERQIRSVWTRLRDAPFEHTGSPWLLARQREIADEIARLDVAYDEWQVVYRQALQLARALRGEPQLLAATQEDAMARPDELDRSRARGPGTTRSLPTPQLIGEIASKATLLVSKEVDLLRQESREDLRSELSMIKGFAAAAVAGITALNLALTAAVFAIASSYASAAYAALGLAGIALVCTVAAAAIAWRKHVHEPLDRTRKTVKEDVQWAKEQMA